MGEKHRGVHNTPTVGRVDEDSLVDSPVVRPWLPDYVQNARVDKATEAYLKRKETLAFIGNLAQRLDGLEPFRVGTLKLDGRELGPEYVLNEGEQSVTEAPVLPAEPVLNQAAD